MKTSTISFVLILAASAVACVSQPEKKPATKTDLTASSLSTTPDLSPYVRVELYAQGANASASPEYLLSQFSSGQAQFDVRRVDGTPVGRLSVQPEECRDDLSAGCERRFSINGRLQAFGASLNCLVPLRNDVNAGYGAQTLSGVCQSQYGRAYTLQMSPR
jgi:hypothetical protein